MCKSILGIAVSWQRSPNPSFDLEIIVLVLLRSRCCQFFNNAKDLICQRPCECNACEYILTDPRRVCSVSEDCKIVNHPDSADEVIRFVSYRRAIFFLEYLSVPVERDSQVFVFELSDVA